jgi:hypothetical protein
MSSDKKEVLQLLSALVGPVQSCREPLDAQAVGNALLGSSQLFFPGCTAVVESFVVRLFEIRFSKSSPLSDLSAIISGADALLQSSVYVNATWIAKLESLRGDLTTHLQLQDCPVSSSKIEASTVRNAQRLFQMLSWQANGKVPVDLRGLHVQVDSNIWLYGYEADIVLKIGGEYRGKRVSDVVVNVEVDGPSHDSLKSQRHSRIRDWRMRQQGVHVERWKVQLLNTSGQTERLFIELVHNVFLSSTATMGKNP